MGGNGMDVKFVNSHVYPMKEVFSSKYIVDFYQRAYVWSKKHMEDLVIDLTSDFLRQWKSDYTPKDVENLDPYFMGEIILAAQEGRYAIIDGQQRITSLTLLLIYIKHNFGNLPNFPDINNMIYSDYFGEKKFNLEIEDRLECMKALFNNGSYTLINSDTDSVKNIVARYNDLGEVWNNKITNENIIPFTYWLANKVCFSKVWTNNDDFAYMIFETMNDRGMSLTQVEMLRSYLLANIDSGDNDRKKAMKQFDELITELKTIKLLSKSKAEFEFFKILFRTQYTDDTTQGNAASDFVRIGKEFHRWFKDKSKDIGLNNASDYINFMNRLSYYGKVYKKIFTLIESRDANKYLYLIVNSDYGFTLQPALIMASIAYNDDDDTVVKKIKIVSKYITKVLSWRVWNQNVISQSALEGSVYDLAKQIRGMTLGDLYDKLAQDPISLPDLSNTPSLNQQNKSKIRVLLALITAIVAVGANEPKYMLIDDDIEVEHIWADKFEDHMDEFIDKGEFASRRNVIGDLLLLPKSFNASYGDKPFSEKVVQYMGQNILAQSLNALKYKNNPGFLSFKAKSNLAFKSYSEFKNQSITERTNLYRGILLYNWK